MLPREFFDRYELLGELGRGGMATVLKARHRELDRLVAVKILDRKLFDDPENLQRFVDESKLTARLNHPNIIQVFEASATYRCAYIVYEFADGDPLAARLDGKTPWPWRDALRFAVQVGEGLEFAHQHGVIHRDVKPENLLIRGNGRVQIADFGLAKTLFRESSFSTVGKVVGTPHYMAPEQARGKGAVPSSDVYALAVVLYELVTGRQPFKGKNAIEVLQKQVRERPRPPVDVNPNCPPMLSEWILRGMAKKAARRIHSAQAFVDGLHAILRGRKPQLKASSRPRGRRIALALGAVVLLGLASWWIHGTRWKAGGPQALRVHAYARTIICLWQSEEEEVSELRVAALGEPFRILRREGLRREHRCRIEALKPGTRVVLRWEKGGQVLEERIVRTLTSFDMRHRVRRIGATWAELVLGAKAPTRIARFFCSDDSGVPWPVGPIRQDVHLREHLLRIEPLQAGRSYRLEAQIEGLDGVESHRWICEIRSGMLADCHGSWPLPRGLAPPPEGLGGVTFLPREERLLVPLSDGRWWDFDLARKIGRVLLPPTGTAPLPSPLDLQPCASGRHLVLPRGDGFRGWQLPSGDGDGEGQFAMRWKALGWAEGDPWPVPGSEDLLLVGRDRPESELLQILRVDGGSGQIRWKQQFTAPKARVFLAGTGRHVVLAGVDGAALALDLDLGRMIWRIDPRQGEGLGAFRPPSIEGSTVALARGNRLSILDLATSRARTTMAEGGEIFRGPVWNEGKGSLWLGIRGKGLRRLSLDEKEGSSSFPMEEDEQFELLHGRLYRRGTRRGLERIARKDGRSLWSLKSLPSGRSGAGSRVFASKGWVWWVDEAGCVHGIED